MAGGGVCDNAPTAAGRQLRLNFHRAHNLARHAKVAAPLFTELTRRNFLAVMFNPPSSRDVSPLPSPPESVRTAPVVPIPSRLEAREAKRKLRKTIGCLCCVALLAVASILIGFSVAIVEYNHVGVLHDTITHRISEQVWGEGRHFVGLGRVFYQYPQRTRLLDFSWLDGTTSYGGDATSIYDADGPAGFTADGQHVTAAVTVFNKSTDIVRRPLTHLNEKPLPRPLLSGHPHCLARGQATARLLNVRRRCASTRPCRRWRRSRGCPSFTSTSRVASARRAARAPAGCARSWTGS